MTLREYEQACGEIDARFASPDKRREVLIALLDREFALDPRLESIHRNFDELERHVPAINGVFERLYDHAVTARQIVGRIEALLEHNRDR